MPRPTEVARTGTWTLVQIAAEAQITRAVARAAVERGLLPKGGYTEADIVLFRVAGACLAFPDPTATPARGRPDSTKRDTTALRFARAALTDPATTLDTVLLLAGWEIEVANTPEQAAAALARMYAVPALVLPIGRWRAMLPSVQRRSPAHPATTLRLVKAPRPDSRIGINPVLRGAAAAHTPDPADDPEPSPSTSTHPSPQDPGTGYAAFTEAKAALTPLTPAADLAHRPTGAPDDDPFALP